MAALSLIYVLLRVRPRFKTEYKTKTGLKFVPLLEQPVNKAFNREKVWVSMSFCYAEAVQYKYNRDAVIRAVLATRLWRDVADANVVLQVYNDTEILKKDIDSLNLVKKSGAHLIWAPPSDKDLCDCALGHSIGRVLLHTLPEFKNKLKNDSIVMLTNVGAYLSKGEILNVLQSGHDTWMFNAEAVLYGHQPFPTNFIAMTVEKWKTITFNSLSCSDLVARDPHLVADYKPPWVVYREEEPGNSTDVDTRDIDIMMAVGAVEKFITRRSLMLRHCTVPDWNQVWISLGAEAGFDPNFFDRDVCWKGMGMASCSNSMGYWHYPGMPGCSWWTETFPQEVFEKVIKGSDPLREMIKETSILFSSN